VGTVLGTQEAQLAPRLLAILVEYRFEEIEGPALSQRALNLVTRLKKVTFYDAAYHAVALLRDGTFVTADDAYVRRARRVGHVVRLREWDLSRR
jgi:predicted nucleic acid-binding protein